jgi:hypothetical protein
VFFSSCHVNDVNDGGGGGGSGGVVPIAIVVPFVSGATMPLHRCRSSLRTIFG